VEEDKPRVLERSERIKRYVDGGGGRADCMEVLERL